MKKALAENELSLIEAVASGPDLTQRQLSERIGLSLGMTNLLLKKLIRKGYVKVLHLDWKRAQYLLTVEGVLEKSRKSYAYALHTLQQFRALRRQMRETVLSERARGTRSAVVIAWPEHQEALREAFEELGVADFSIEFVETFRQLADRPGVVFSATVEDAPRPRPGQRIVPLLDANDVKFSYAG